METRLKIKTILAYWSSEIDSSLSRTLHTQGSFLWQGSPLSSEKNVSILSSLSLLKIWSDRDDPYGRDDYMGTRLKRASATPRIAHEQAFVQKLKLILILPKIKTTKNSKNSFKINKSPSITFRPKFSPKVLKIFAIFTNYGTVSLWFKFVFVQICNRYTGGYDVIKPENSTLREGANL